MAQDLIQPKKDIRKGPYLVIDSKEIYKSHWLTVTEDKVIKPDETDGVFTTVDYLPGISVIAINKQKEVFLIREFYYVLNEFGIQLPSGGIEPQETPIQAAQKELKEETGIEAKTWIDLGMIHPFTMFIKSPTHLFLAEDIITIDTPEEGIDVIKVPFDQAYQMAMENKIFHAQSIITIIRAKAYLDNMSR